jgi:hypothetical protein
MPRKGEFPTRDNCDPNDPEEAFLWMFAALPHVRGAPLIMPTEYYRAVSKRLWDLGCRPTQEPTLEWVAPSATEPHWLTSPGRWVSACSAPKRTEQDDARHAIANMSMQQKAELLKVLEDLEAGEPLADTPAGRVVNTLTFHQRDVVLEVLRGDRGA